ncbi:hypothetical protein JX265_013991 [Neoarthrinium moseri]|uniref:Uncharacterized protein n=1 Tax=Neoarthrinium moseri TaxID=1658444 RepID=A0A9P9W7I9_9PEZI|nr:hypothetical protein JX265_013991 [Neoarthrinium moseri]
MLPDAEIGLAVILRCRNASRRSSAEAMAENFELEELRQKLAQETRLRKDEQHRREAAEDLAKRPSLRTSRASSNPGEVTNPIGRVFPRRIIPWHAFPTAQEQIWAQISTRPAFSSNCHFPSQHQIDYVMSLIEPISSDVGLRAFVRDTVENAVKKLVDTPVLRRKLDLQGNVTFESHTNLGGPQVHLSKSTGRLSVIGDDLANSNSERLQSPSPAEAEGNEQPGRPILHLSGCLQYEIQPEHDVINNDGEGFEFTSKSLASAVITQPFSYMIGKGIQYGYVYTGEALAFLHIPNDPTTVYYSPCIPNLDVMDDGDLKLHRTAVAQVFAFGLNRPNGLARYSRIPEHMGHGI